MKPTINEVLNLFIGKDTLRPVMLQPNLENGFVYATNGYCLIKIPSKLLTGEFSKVEKFPNCESAIGTAVLLEKPLTISISKLADLINTIPKEPIYKECKTCDGEGVVECNLGHDHFCEDCDGDGTLKEKIGEKINSNNNPLKIGVAHYSPVYLEYIIKACQSQDIESFVITHQGHNTAMIAKVNDILILAMPITYSSESHRTEYIYSE